MSQRLSKKTKLAWFSSLVVTGIALFAITRSAPALNSAKPTAAQRDELAAPGAPLVANRRALTPSEVAEAPAPKEGTAVVTGKLVDAETGAPVRGILVRCTAGGESQLTDAAGAFKFERLPVGPRFGILAAKDDPRYLPEVIDVRIRNEMTSHDLGSVRLVRGDGRVQREHAEAETGIVHELRDGKTFISRVRPGTAAEAAGLHAGYRIVSVDGKSADGLGYTSRSHLLDGDADSRVTLVVETRAGQQRSVSLRRVPAWTAARTNPAR